MNILLLLIPVALLLGGLGLAGFIWSTRSGQFDDLDGAAMRVLIDNDRPDATGTMGAPVADGKKTGGAPGAGEGEGG